MDSSLHIDGTLTGALSPTPTMSGELSTAPVAQPEWTDLGTQTVTEETTSVFVDVPETAKEIELKFVIYRTTTTNAYVWFTPNGDANHNSFNRYGQTTNACVYGFLHITLWDGLMSSYLMCGSGAAPTNLFATGNQGWINGPSYTDFQTYKRVGIILSTGIGANSTLAVRYK